MKIISNLLLLATLIFSSLVASGSHSAEKKHIVAIDAGSTGSRVYIYEYTTPRGQLIPTIHLAEDITNDPATAWVKKIKPGVSSFADNTSEIEPYITQFTNYISQKIPSTIDKATVPVIFQASAGMRVLEKSTQDNIVKKIKLTLASNGFSKNLVEVITGQDEGIYGWLGINYLLGNLTKERRQLTAGILDMGGSSFQVAFEPRASYTPTTDGHIKDIAIGHHHYNIYSVSYSGYGEISARKKWTAPVCELSDTSAPSNFQDCKAHILNQIKMEHHADTPAGLNGQFQPEFNGNDFVGTDNIAEVAKFLPLGPFSNGALIEKGEEICSLSIRSLSKDYPRKSLHDLDRACFDAAYISAIMSGYNTEHPYQGLGLEDEAKIVHGIEFINDKPINWTLGSALYFLLENDENE